MSNPSRSLAVSARVDNKPAHADVPTADRTVELANLHPAELNPLIAQVVDDHLVPAAARSVWLEFLPEINLPLAWFDAQLLNHLVSDLLRAAMAYTLGGGVIVLLTAEREHAGEYWVTVTLKINGPGRHSLVGAQLGDTSSSVSGSPVESSDADHQLVGCQAHMARLNGRLTVGGESGQETEITLWLKPVV